MIREILPSPGVMPKLSPTVPTAEAVSNIHAIMGSSSMRLMRNAPVRQRLRYIIRMEAAFATVSVAIRRLNISGSGGKNCEGSGFHASCCRTGASADEHQNDGQHLAGCAELAEVCRIETGCSRSNRLKQG